MEMLMVKVKHLDSQMDFLKEILKVTQTVKRKVKEIQMVIHLDSQRAMQKDWVIPREKQTDYDLVIRKDLLRVTAKQRDSHSVKLMVTQKVMAILMVRPKDCDLVIH